MAVRPADSGALSELGILPKYMHFLLAAHIHIALGAGDGLRGAPVHISMLRNALSARCFSGGASLEQARGRASGVAPLLLPAC